jgi:hypothetical protein
MSNMGDLSCEYLVEAVKLCIFAHDHLGVCTRICIMWQGNEEGLGG